MIGDLGNNGKIFGWNNVKDQCVCKIFKITIINTDVKSTC